MPTLTEIITAVFQSLSRDSGRLNERKRRKSPGARREVSIPQSGFGAFELYAEDLSAQGHIAVSIPQSGFGAFERS
mgnify:CR=1 FL=1